MLAPAGTCPAWRTEILPPLVVPSVFLAFCSTSDRILCFFFFFQYLVIEARVQMAQHFTPFLGPTGPSAVYGNAQPSPFRGSHDSPSCESKTIEPHFLMGLNFFPRVLCAVRVNFRSFFCIRMRVQSCTLPLLLLGLLCGSRGNFSTLPRAVVDQHCKDCGW